MRKRIIISAILVLMAPTFTAVFAQDNDTPDTKIWTLEDCLQYGLKYHPKVIMADQDVKIQEAALLSTKASFDPKVNASVNLNNSKDQRRGNVTSFHSNSGQSESVSISKKLYDSGKFSLQKKQSKETLEAAKKDRETTLISMAANIKTMFFKAQQAQRMLQVKLETLDGYEKHLKKVETFVEVGTHAPYDITKAQVNVANARVDLISARSTLKEALVNVGNAIGVDHPIHVAAYELEALPDIDESVKQDYVKIALERPEVKSSEAKLRSAKYRISEARTSLKPTLNSSAGYSWSQTHTP
ncbi:MAG: TolC family protein, partial [Candidatus Riflebacteria bacterium]|nr:TolC family protein [Candidatus Riflebacteria bacterium]